MVHSSVGTTTAQTYNACEGRVNHVLEMCKVLITLYTAVISHLSDCDTQVLKKPALYVKMISQNPQTSW